jgi:hypothetical protein
LITRRCEGAQLPHSPLAYHRISPPTSSHPSPIPPHSAECRCQCQCQCLPTHPLTWSGAKPHSRGTRYAPGASRSHCTSTRRAASSPSAVGVGGAVGEWGHGVSQRGVRWRWVGAVRCGAAGYERCGCETAVRGERWGCHSAWEREKSMMWRRVDKRVSERKVEQMS